MLQQAPHLATLGSSSEAPEVPVQPAPSVRHVCVTCGHGWTAPHDGPALSAKARVWTTCAACKRRVKEMR